MQIVTSWMEQGIAEGEQRGRLEGERSLVMRLLTRRLGTLPTSVEAQVQALDLPRIVVPESCRREALSEALLDFAQWSNLNDWLQVNS